MLTRASHLAGKSIYPFAIPDHTGRVPVFMLITQILQHLAAMHLTFQMYVTCRGTFMQVW